MNDIHRKTIDARIVPQAKGFSATITSETLDRDGEVVIAQGMNATEFEQNPILLFNHDTNKPVGRCVALKRKGGAVEGEFVFAQRPEGYTGEYFPEFVASLVGQGIVKGISIGYAAEQGGIRRASADDRTRFGDRVHTVFSKWRLLEVSIAPIPANPDAIISAIRKGLVDGRAAKRFLGVEEQRHRISVEIPAEGLSPKPRRPITVDDIVRREIARARGRITL